MCTLIRYYQNGAWGVGSTAFKCIANKYHHIPKFRQVFASRDFTNHPCGLVMQIIHVSYLFIISSVLKQILASLDLSERQFCCFFVFVAVERFFLHTYEHLPPLPSPKYANVCICTTPSPPDCVRTKWMVPLDKCIQIFKGISIKKGGQEMARNAENVSKYIYNLEWSIQISSVSLRTLASNKFNKAQCLPLTEDLLTVQSYFLEQIPKLTSALNSKPILQIWRLLSEMVGVRLTLFNRTRFSEVFGMLVSHFNDRQQWKSQEMEEVKLSLTQLSSN